VFTTSPACQLGTLIDRRYRLQRAVGEGASSWVFVADDLRLDREVALKLFRPPSSEHDVKRRKRCVAEGRTLAKLVHPHIVAIHDASEDGSGQSYLVMELCEAGTLEAELAQRGTLDTLETLKLILPLMGAVAFAHDRNVVHRDIKPGNIVVLRESGERRCKLLDFGISLSAGIGTSSDLGLGTPSYMSPEQARGEPPTPATDVWALGVVLYRCLTGELPFQASNDAALLYRIARERAPRFGTVAASKVPPNLALVLDRALERDLERRHRDVRSFARAIAVASSLDGIPLPPRPEPIGLPLFEHWLADARGVERTLDLDSPCAPALVHAEHPASRVRRVRKAALAAAICAVGGSALLAFMSSDRARHAEVAPSGLRTGGREVEPGVRSHAAAAQEIAAAPRGAPPPRSELAVPAPTNLGPGRAPPTPKRTRRKVQGDAERKQTLSPPRTPRRLLTDWDWQ
jgi:tRNA A-37 threonylcarbamoyl transferase component Bud32